MQSVPIYKIRNRLRVGQKVKTTSTEGIIGEISNDHIFVWQNEFDGTQGRTHSSAKGYKYSWAVGMNGGAHIEILEEYPDIIWLEIYS